MTIDFTVYKTRLENMCEEAITGSAAMPDPLLAESKYPFWLINIRSAIRTRRVNPQVVRREVSTDLILVRGGVGADSHGVLWTTMLSDGGTVLNYFETNRTMLTADQTRADMIAGMIPGSIEIDWTEAGTISVGVGNNARLLRGTQYLLTFAIQNRTTQTNV